MLAEDVKTQVYATVLRSGNPGLRQSRPLLVVLVHRRQGLGRGLAHDGVAIRARHVRKRLRRALVVELSKGICRRDPHGLRIVPLEHVDERCDGADIGEVSE